MGQDLCACLRLKSRRGDVALARLGRKFALLGLLQAAVAASADVGECPTVVPWSGGGEVLSTITTFLAA